MSAVRPSRAFTLIESMIVVVMVGILALIANVGYRRWVRNSYIGEAHNMLGNIRSSQEAFRAENGGYLNVSNGLTGASLFPSTAPKGSFVTQWGPSCAVCTPTTGWAALNVNPDGPVRFGYAVVANNTGVTAPPAINANGQAANLSSMTGQPWYVAAAICDLDSDGALPDTTLYAVSGTNQLFVNDEGQ
jgi:type IV pilus assembly protein PilA